jgi:UDP-N-acetylmuramyl pentapeptide phosphotransferase/UDP-N-acetylglucosamine-1-phosphate transferase
MLQIFFSIMEWHDLSIFLLSLSLCVVLVLIAPKVPRFFGDGGHTEAVQAMHERETPRVGGIAIFAALLTSCLFVPDIVSEGYRLFVVSASIIFFVGLLEDLGFGISPKMRLLAAAVASLTAIALLGVWLPRTGIPGLDALMPYWMVGVPITLLATAGVANAVNMIDGVNGLAAVASIFAAVSLGMISSQAGYEAMTHLTMMLAASVLGFFVVNYPRGWLFLGDAGAYTIGFVLSWFGISILLNVPDASPWAILLTMFWPVADMLLAIYRRARRNVTVSAPDRLHSHQMVMRALEICVLGRGRRHIANPLCTLVLAPFVAAPPVVGIILWNDVAGSFVAMVGFGVLFFGAYLAIPRILIRCKGAEQAQLNPAE